DWPATFRQANEELALLDERLDVRAPAGSLSVGRRVMAEVAAAVGRRPAVLFLDEPTASLTAAESRRLFERLFDLKEAGVAIVYVSHRLDEVLKICDVITVLRDGRHVVTEPAGSLDMDRLVSLMVGRETSSFFSRTHGRPGATALQALDLSCPERRFQGVSFSLSKGEIVGLYGLVGSGRSEMCRAIFGLAPFRGTIRLDGNKHSIRDPAEAMRRGMAYLPEDRLTEGIFASHSCRSNVTSAVLRRLARWGVISGARERSVTDRVVERFDVRLGTPEQPIQTLSGGNQQKLLLGRWLETNPEVLILDEPTRGVDVGTKAQIHRLMDELAAEGKAILLVSSELPELMGMSDRVLVMCEGRLAGEFDPRKTPEETVAAAAFPRTANSRRPKDAQPDHGFTGRLVRIREIGIAVALVAIVLVMSLLRASEFATVKNLLDVLTAASIVSVAAAGMTLVIASGGIDISIGSLLGLIGAVAGMCAVKGVPPAVCLGMAVVLGAGLGSLNGTLSRLGNIHPIIVTLAGISIYRGVMLQITGGYEITPLPPGYRLLVDGRLVGVPKVLWIAIGVLAGNWLLVSRTLLGRRLLAVGNSEKASRLIGLSPWRLRIIAFAMLGACVGLASVMWGGYYGKIQSNTGQGWELLVIAAAVIGGCSITGGRGTALGAFLGSVLIALVYNALNLLKVSSYWQSLFVGCLILGAVVVDVWVPVLVETARRRKAGRGK
ncbi:MAG: ATP-binding cassette domain-containing protein, partial [Planctomycetota bacterium]